MMLVDFAGKDPDETPLEYRAPRTHKRPERAYELFKLGSDTWTLSRRFAITEATVHRWVTMERCRQRGLPSPYGVRS